MCIKGKQLLWWGRQTQQMMMMKPNAGSTSKSNNANVLPPKKLVAPDTIQAVQAPSPAMATRMLAEVEEPEAAAVRAEKIAARWAALGPWGSKCESCQ